MRSVDVAEAKTVVGGAFTAQCLRLVERNGADHTGGFDRIYRNVSVDKKNQKKADKACKSAHGSGFNFNQWL
ncbi:hypothetical protein [Aeromonas jandaei]|uniref:hypothetical protein n=1 Tax=Aeromonas TaxID=642 RepID=UPI003B9EA6BF